MGRVKTPAPRRRRSGVLASGTGRCGLGLPALARPLAGSPVHRRHLGDTPPLFLSAAGHDPLRPHCQTARPTGLPPRVTSAGSLVRGPTVFMSPEG